VDVLEVVLRLESGMRYELGEDRARQR